MLIRTANVLRRLDERWTDGDENRKLRALSAPASPPSRRFLLYIYYITHASGLESRTKPGPGPVLGVVVVGASFFLASSSLDPGRHVPSAVLNEDGSVKKKQERGSTF